jgi:hypothetical protein
MSLALANRLVWAGGGIFGTLGLALVGLTGIDRSEFKRFGHTKTTQMFSYHKPKVFYLLKLRQRWFSFKWYDSSKTRVNYWFEQ